MELPVLSTRAPVHANLLGSRSQPPARCALPAAPIHAAVKPDAGSEMVGGGISGRKQNSNPELFWQSVSKMSFF